MNPLVTPVVRRAILDLLEDIGGEQNDDVLTILLNGLGHRVARRDVVEQLIWLAGVHKLVTFEELGPYIVTSIRADGRDVATGRLILEDISRHKTGD